MRCILLKFYIKPQRRLWLPCSQTVVSYWNSTSNHNSITDDIARRVVVSYWNSTSNHNTIHNMPYPNSVVSYWNSTSNHNRVLRIHHADGVVSYWNSTSNHNCTAALMVFLVLYLIEILHQTTTCIQCVLILLSCILLKFYIKPQRFRRRPSWSSVVSYWNSTSNHNIICPIPSTIPLYLIEILHQTTTTPKQVLNLA